MAKVSNFVIVTLPRSGSYHLVSLLDSAPDVVCHGEILKTDYIELRPFYLERLKLTKSDIELRNADQLGFVQRLRQINRFKNVGFKIFPGHINRDQKFNEGLMNNPEWHKIFLFRNPLESYASLLRAKQTGVWVVTNSANHAEEKLNAKVAFDKESFEQHLGTCRWFAGICDRVEKIPKNKVFRTDYAKLANPEHMAKMLKFIGSTTEVSALASDKQRQFSAPFEEGFSNWPEFKAYLTEHGMLDKVPAAK